MENKCGKRVIKIKNKKNMMHVVTAWKEGVE